jgi:Skp family chaperone for outer membrane proteins
VCRIRPSLKAVSFYREGHTRQAQPRGDNSPVKEDPKRHSKGVLNVKKYLLSSAIVAALFVAYFAWSCLSSTPALAQQPGMSPGAMPNVCLVDVNYIFKKHVRLKAQLKELTAEGEKVQKEFEDELRALQEESKKLGPGGFKPGTPQYAELEERLVSQRSVIQGKIQLKRKEFVQREAHLYYNAYQEISDEVKHYCEQRGIAMVMNFNGDTIHEDSPDDVARGISNKIVYYNKQLPLDITPYVMQRFVKDLPANAGPVGFNTQDRR